MSNALHTHTVKARTLAGAALVALVTMLTLSLVAPSTAQAATQTASVNPATAAAGEPVTITGSGFLPGEMVDVNYGGSTIATGVADASGDFSVSGAIPAAMPEGGHPMDVMGSMGSSVTFSYTVAAPAPPAPAPPVPATPSGSPSSPASAPSVPAPSASTPPVSSPETPTSPEPGDTTDSTVDAVDDGDDERELALGDTAGTGDEAGSDAVLWVLVILVLAAAGFGVFVAMRRTDRSRA